MGGLTDGGQGVEDRAADWGCGGRGVEREAGMGGAGRKEDQRYRMNGRRVCAGE